MDLAELRQGAKEGIVTPKKCLRETCDSNALEDNELCQSCWNVLTADQKIDDVTCRAPTCCNSRSPEGALCKSCYNIYCELNEAVSKWQNDLPFNSLPECITANCDLEATIYKGDDLKRCYEHSAIANGDLEMCSEPGCYDGREAPSEYCSNHVARKMPEEDRTPPDRKCFVTHCTKPAEHGDTLCSYHA